MPNVTPSTVRQQIKSRTPELVYLLQGEDEVEKSALAHEFEELVEEELRAFNVERIHAGDLTSGDKLAAAVGSLIAAARTFPMMSPRRVVVVFQADALLVPKRESEAGNRALDDLQGLLNKPEKETTIVFVAGSLDKRSRMFKLLAKQAAIVECGAIESQADAERWVRNRVVAAGSQIEAAGARLLAERGWNDIKRLRNDVERLLLFALGEKVVTQNHVRQIVGAATLQDVWAMTNAIENGNGAEALRQLALMLDAGEPPEKILGQLGWLVRAKFPALAPARLSSAVDSLLRTDLDLKRSAGEPRILLERLVVELSTSRSGRRA
jgi:DNA polymerase-3 subunit delta